MEVKDSAAIFRPIHDETRIENRKLVNTRDGKRADGTADRHIF